MDELDLLAASRAQNPSMHSSSIVPSIGSEPSLTCSGTFAAVHGSAEGRLSSTPSSTLRAWVVGDYTSEMTNALVALGLRIHHIRRWQNLRWYNSGRLELLDEERPHLVLILAPKTMVKGKQAAKHCQKLADLILRQSRQGRHLAFYGNPVWPVWSPSTALSSGWREVLQHQSFFRTELRWCNMALSHPETGQGFWTKTLVLSSMRLWSGDGSPTACRCELGSDALGHAKTDDLHDDRFCLREQLWTKVNYYLVALILSGRPLTRSTLGPGIRPELLMKGGWSPKMGTSQSVLAKEPKLQMSDGDDAKVAALAAVGPQLGGEPSLTDTVVSTKARVSVSFPTDQRARQKARKAQGHVAKKKPQTVEDHHDDCGEDFGPLGDDYFANDTFDPYSELISDSEDEVCCLVDFDHGLNGSTFEPHEQHDHSVACSPMHFDDLASFTTWNESKVKSQHPPGRHYHDVAELCGGAGGTGTLLVRRGWRKGPNFDIIVGFDLTKHDTKDHFLSYLKTSKPTVLIISTPCTGMKGFSGINRLKNHATWLRSRRTSVPLANLGGLAAMLQMQAGRHFIAEHPHGSDMWSMTIWRNIEGQGAVRAIVHQCMAGLVGLKSGLPIMKPTQFLASDEALVSHLHDLRCDGSHRHTQLDNPAGAHGDKAKDAAKWPPKLCHRIARGCEDLLRTTKPRTNAVMSHHQPVGKPPTTTTTTNAKIASTPSSMRPRTPHKVRFDIDLFEAPEAPEAFPGSSSDGGCLGCRRNRVQTGGAQPHPRAVSIPTR